MSSDRSDTGTTQKGWGWYFRPIVFLLAWALTMLVGLALLDILNWVIGHAF